ncbi:MFS transporter [Nocardioides sp.]|uniref:MFS transporter n=1 Tax=Nocardioides sp. TaxID=35761 RepID=UPI00356A773D
MTRSLPVDIEAAQRHTITTLVISQAVGAVGITIGVATASLLARDVSGSETLAGLVQTFQVLGSAVAAYLLARLMSARGRRMGLVTGYLLGATGSLLAVVAAVLGSMTLLLFGAVLLGSTTAANNSARYAATDLATEEKRGRALSTVVWATTIGAVAGPNLSGPAGAFANGVGIPVLAGPFAFGALGMTLAALVVWIRLRPDPLLLAREAATAGEPVDLADPVEDVPDARTSSWRLARQAVHERPVLGWAILGLAGSHAAMIGVMTMTPLHMEHGGASLRIIGIVISVHVLGMFAFAPVMGWLADRIGRDRVLLGGGILLLVSLVLCALAPEGNSTEIFAGLFLLGLGWSAATVSASTLISDHAPLAVRTDVQGTADLVMGLTAAAAGALAGVVNGLLGYPTLAVATVALALAVILAGVRTPRHAPSADGGLAQLPS